MKSIPTLSFLFLRFLMILSRSISSVPLSDRPLFISYTNKVFRHPKMINMYPKTNYVDPDSDPDSFESVESDPDTDEGK